MKWPTLFFVVAILELFAGTAKAQILTISNIDNTSGRQLTITAKITGLGAGQTAGRCQVLARPPGGAGGSGGTKDASNTGGGVYTGTIVGLTSGNNYDVQAVITINDRSSGKLVTRYIYSSTRTNQRVR